MGAEPGAADRAACRTPERSGFYGRTLHRLLEGGMLRREMSVLVVCGGEADRDVFLGLGFGDVTISNLAGGSDEAVRPYRWAVEDAEQLSYDDESFDLVAVSGGLHHCRSPHRALIRGGVHPPVLSSVPPWKQLGTPIAARVRQTIDTLAWASQWASAPGGWREILEPD